MVESDTPTTLQLLREYARSIEVLRERGIVRTRNIVGCYGEYLFAKAMEWKLERNASRGFDARGTDGRRHQIKARRITRRNPSTQMGDLPAGDIQEFDALAAVIFAEDFGVVRAAVIATPVLLRLRTKSPTRPRFHLSDSVMKAAGVMDVTDKLREAQRI